MSTIKVDTIATRTGSGNITVSNNAVLSGDLTVDTNTLFVDASADKVGINQTSPTYQLSVLGATQSTVEIESASTTGESRLYMTDPDATGVGEIGYYHNGDTMRFNTGGAERMRLSSAGLHIGGTGAANALDDYEEGTWTPTMSGGYSSSPTHTRQTGTYTKVGRLVTAHASIAVSAGTRGGSQVSITGLPFTVGSLDGGGFIVYQGNFHSSSNDAYPFCNANSQIVYFHEENGTGINANEMDADNYDIRLILVYYTA